MLWPREQQDLTTFEEAIYVMFEEMQNVGQAHQVYERMLNRHHKAPDELAKGKYREFNRLAARCTLEQLFWQPPTLKWSWRDLRNWLELALRGGRLLRQGRSRRRFKEALRGALTPETGTQRDRCATATDDSRRQQRS